MLPEHISRIYCALSISSKYSMLRVCREWKRVCERIEFSPTGINGVYTYNIQIRWKYVWRYMQRDMPTRYILHRDAASEGYLNLLLELHPVNQPRHLCTPAAERGHLHVLKWLRSCGHIASYEALSSAVMHGHLHVLQWMWQDVNHGSYALPIENAARGGHAHILDWLYSINCSVSVEVMVCAARGGHLHVVRWLRGHTVEGFTTIVSTDRICPWDEHTFHVGVAHASQTGNMELLEWLWNNECPRPQCAYATRLEVILFLLQKGMTLHCAVDISKILYEPIDIRERLRTIDWLVTQDQRIELHQPALQPISVNNYCTQIE
jgi:hypothetical protein